MTGREAAALLSAVLPVREHARLVLGAGLAGEPVRTSAALLYDAAAVHALAERPPVTARELARVCPRGLLVARLSRQTSVEVRAPWAETAAVVAVQPCMPPMTAALAGARLRARDGHPWIATLCGYVVLCAEARGLVAERDRIRFDLSEPGEWADALAGRPLPTRRGRPWTFLDPGRPISAPEAR